MILEKQPAIILNSLPKSGTHLLIRLFQLLPNYSHSGVVLTNQTTVGCEDSTSSIMVGITSPKRIKKSAFIEIIEKSKPSQYHFGHLPYSPTTCEILEHRDIKMILLVRDPRAVVCSNVHFILKHKHHELFQAFSSMPDLESQIKLAIRGFSKIEEGDHIELLSINDCFKSITDWVGHTKVPIVFFEELIGPNGGGCLESQQKAIDRILRYIGYEFTFQQLQQICEQLFLKTSLTFFRGQINGWHKDFSPCLDKYFDLHAAQSLSGFKKLFSEYAYHKT